LAIPLCAWLGFCYEQTRFEVQVRAVIPTGGGCAVFLGNGEKVFVIQVDQSVGAAIAMFLRGTQKQRPLTHDLIAHVLHALGARIERVIVNDLKCGIYFARLIVSAENELHQRKIIEFDARPSDCIAMATQQRAPIYVSGEVWEAVEDMAEVLRMIEEKSTESGEDEK
jgi:bifunctional DNase/RNase